MRLYSPRRGLQVLLYIWIRSIFNPHPKVDYILREEVTYSREGSLGGKRSLGGRGH